MNPKQTSELKKWCILNNQYEGEYRFKNLTALFEWLKDSSTPEEVELKKICHTHRFQRTQKDGIQEAAELYNWLISLLD